MEKVVVEGCSRLTLKIMRKFFKVKMHTLFVLVLLIVLVVCPNKVFDPSEFARELMVNFVVALNQELEGGDVDPKRLLKEAFRNTKILKSNSRCQIRAFPSRVYKQSHVIVEINKTMKFFANSLIPQSGFFVFRYFPIL